MVNIVIIGNGFDMAHGLQTSYNSFLKNLIDEKFNNKNLYPELFNINQNFAKNINCYDDIRKRGDLNITRNIFKTNNKLFNSLTNDVFDLNWCDIEKLYFKELSNIGQSNHYKSATKLNSDFKVIKNYLEEYLIKEQLNFEPIWVYEQFFERLSFETSLVLNFNYTSTIQSYVNGYNVDLVQIHGMLRSKLIL